MKKSLYEVTLSTGDSLTVVAISLEEALGRVVGSLQEEKKEEKVMGIMLLAEIDIE